VFRAWTDLDRLDDGPLVTVTLAQTNGRTEMTLVLELPASFSADEMPEGWFDHMQVGWRDTVDRLAAALARPGV
jgi:uncharacterized protein YndB with AHSA1/START domain